MATPALTQKEKLLKLLLKNRKGLTTREAARRGINRVPARIFDLRVEGFRIYTNKRRGPSGRPEYSFRLDNSHR